MSFFLAIAYWYPPTACYSRAAQWPAHLLLSAVIVASAVDSLRVNNKTDEGRLPPALWFWPLSSMQECIVISKSRSGRTGCDGISQQNKSTSQKYFLRTYISTFSLIALRAGLPMNPAYSCLRPRSPVLVTGGWEDKLEDPVKIIDVLWFDKQGGGVC